MTLAGAAALATRLPMSLYGMLHDKVTLVKPDGRVFRDIRCSVSPESITFDDVKIPMEEGDHFERALPSGLTETYLVLDRGFYDKFHGIPAHYQAKVRKLSTIEIERRQHTSISIQGDNSRVNINSADHSSNVVGTASAEMFSVLAALVADRVAANQERAALLRAIEGMRGAQRQPGFLKHYQEFITAAANHMTIIAPFLPALAKCLEGAS